MTCETKIRTLASQDAGLQAIFGTSPFRWFHLQLPPGYVDKMPGTCATVQQISVRFMRAQEALVNLNKPRFQIVVRDKNVDVVDQAAAAIVLWLQQVDFASDNEFNSPATPGPQNGNFILDMRPGLDYELKPNVPTMLIDFAVWNKGLI